MEKRSICFAKLNLAAIASPPNWSAIGKSDICDWFRQVHLRLLTHKRTKSTDFSMIPAKKDFTASEWKLIWRLNTPARVQRFFSSIPHNWELKTSTLRSFRELMKQEEVHCLEAAVASAVILEQHGYPPPLLDSESYDLFRPRDFCFQRRRTMEFDCAFAW